MSVPEVTQQQLPQPYLVGPRARWARDFGLIGLASGAMGPSIMAVAPGVMLAAGLVGASVGSLIGFMAPGVLERVRGRVPIPVLLLLGVPAGAVWGAAAGYAAGIASVSSGGLFLSPTLWATVAAFAGAAQLGVIWFPYTFLSVLRKPTWPVVVLACIGSVGLGPLAIQLFSLVVGL